MDTSKFSVMAAISALNVHIPHLSFKQLSYFVRNEEREGQVGDMTYTYTLWVGHVVMSARLSLNDYVYAIPVRTTGPFVSASRGGGFTEERILLRRDDGASLSALFQRTKFRLPDRTVPTYDSESSVITFVESDKHFAKLVCPPPDFGIRFWEHVRKWVDKSIEVRRAAISDLENLQTKCVTESSRYQAEKLVAETAHVREQCARKFIS